MESEASSEVQRPQRDEDLFMNHVKNGNGVRKNSANDAEKFELWAIGARSMIVGGQTNSEKEYINHWRQAYKDFIFEHETHKTAEYKQWRRERPDKGRHWDAETREVRLNIPPKLFQYYEQLSKGRTPDPELGEWPLSKTHNDWLRMIAMMDIDPYQLELSQPDWNRSSTLDPNGESFVSWHFSCSILIDQKTGSRRLILLTLHSQIQRKKSRGSRYRSRNPNSCCQSDGRQRLVSSSSLTPIKERRGASSSVLAGSGHHRMTMCC